MCEEEREKKLVQGKHSARTLKARVDAKTVDGVAVIVRTKENAMKKFVVKMFRIPLDLAFSSIL